MYKETGDPGNSDARSIASASETLGGCGFPNLAPVYARFPACAHTKLKYHECELKQKKKQNCNEPTKRFVVAKTIVYDNNHLVFLNCKNHSLEILQLHYSVIAYSLW